VTKENPNKLLLEILSIRQAHRDLNLSNPPTSRLPAKMNLKAFLRSIFPVGDHHIVLRLEKHLARSPPRQPYTKKLHQQYLSKMQIHRVLMALTSSASRQNSVRKLTLK
jgi:hypothetical protein